MLGDEAYASPEQLRAEPVTERADVFSLGVLAFRILTGHLPFRASASGSSVRDESVAPLRLRELLPEADEATETLLGRCLNRRPEQRPFAEEVTHLIN
jgi:serine/threonine-protein kinase